jgi:hypothetical protein
MISHGPGLEPNYDASYETSPEPQEPYQPPPQYAYAPELVQARQELDSLRATLAQEREARLAVEAQRQNDLAALEEFNRVKRERDIESLMNVDDLEFNSLDPDDAKKLIKPIYERIVQTQEEKYNELATRLEEQRQFLAKQAQGAQEAYFQQKRDEFNSALAKEVPNIEQLTRTPAYKQFVESPHAPGSVVTMRDHLNEELRRGNAGYVIGKLKQFAQNKPNLANVAQVGSATTGYQAPVNKPEGDSLKTMRDRMNKLRANQISRQEYRALKRQTQAAGPPVSV